MSCLPSKFVRKRAVRRHATLSFSNFLPNKCRVVRANLKRNSGTYEYPKTKNPQRPSTGTGSQREIPEHASEHNRGTACQQGWRATGTVQLLFRPRWHLLPNEAGEKNRETLSGRHGAIGLARNRMLAAAVLTK